MASNLDQLLPTFRSSARINISRYLSGPSLTSPVFSLFLFQLCQTQLRWISQFYLSNRHIVTHHNRSTIFWVRSLLHVDESCSYLFVHLYLLSSGCPFLQKNSHPLFSNLLTKNLSRVLQPGGVNRTDGVVQEQSLEINQPQDGCRTEIDFSCNQPIYFFH